MKTNRRVLIFIGILMIFIMFASTSCIPGCGSPYVRPGMEEEADALVDELIEAGKSDEGEDQTKSEEDTADQPEKKVSLGELHNDDNFGEVDYVFDFTYPVATNDDRAKVVFFIDAQGDWRYSILSETPGLLPDQYDLYGWGYWRVHNLSDWSGPSPDELFPCNGDGPPTDWMTICAGEPGSGNWSSYYVIYAIHNGPIDWNNPMYFTSHTLAVDADGITDNNFQYQAPFDGDYFHNTDHQYDAWYDRDMGIWVFHVLGENFNKFPTDARFVGYGNTGFWIVPAADWEIEAPPVRVTTFLTEGGMLPEDSGYNTIGDTPLDNLVNLEADPILMVDPED